MGDCFGPERSTIVSRPSIGKILKSFSDSDAYQGDAVAGQCFCSSGSSRFWEIFDATLIDIKHLNNVPVLDTRLVDYKLLVIIAK